MKVINPAARQKDDPAIAELQAYMSNREEATYENIRADLETFADLDDNEIEQRSSDAGFNSELDN